MRPDPIPPSHGPPAIIGNRMGTAACDRRRCDQPAEAEGLCARHLATVWNARLANDGLRTIKKRETFTGAGRARRNGIRIRHRNTT